MDQKIEAPSDDDIDYIARMILYAGSIAGEITSSGLTGDLQDLKVLQKVLDTNAIEREATQALVKKLDGRGVPFPIKIL